MIVTVYVPLGSDSYFLALQRLQFMRTQTEVDGEEVLAVYMKKACDYLSVSPTAFTFA